MEKKKNQMRGFFLDINPKDLNQPKILLVKTIFLLHLELCIENARNVGYSD